MNSSVAVFRDDLVNPKLTSNMLDDARHQVRLGADICAYITVDDARDIAAAWSVLAQEIDAGNVAVAS